MLKNTHLIIGLISIAFSLPARACEFHRLLGLTDPTASWPSMPFSVADSLSAKLGASGPAGSLPVAAAITDPSIIKWRINTTNAKGHSPTASINNIVSQVLADVETVAYSATNVYIKASGVPTHDVGPFGNNPNNPTNQNRTFRITRAPAVNNGTKTNVGLGSIGVMVNGVPIFDSRDAMSYNNQNIWHQNANVYEAATFDAAKGHPQQQGAYHYHQSPLALVSQIDPGNTGQHHSPLLGFAYDGFPIYGPYGYTNSDGTGPVKLIKSSYQTRAITQRTTLPSGAALTAGQYGPAVSATTPLGSYVEDFAYLAASGDLDQYNGRFVVTPEYPLGTYAYFVTTDGAGNAAYPYIIGPQYYGIVDTGNLQGGNIIVPADVTFYTAPVPEPAMIGLAALVFILGGRNRALSRAKTGV